MRQPKTALPGLGPAAQEMVQLLARCPRIPTDVIYQLLTPKHPGSTRQLLARLRGAGVVRMETVAPGILLGSRSVRLWSLTAAALAGLGEHDAVLLAAVVDRIPYGAPDHPRDPARQAVPSLLAAYRALGAFALELGSRPRIRSWEQPWVRSLVTPRSNQMHHVRLSAAAVLAADSALVPVLLLPDIGSAPVVSYRTLLKRLLELRRANQEAEEPLLVIVTSDFSTPCARTEAWRSLLRRVATSAGEPPLRAQIVAWKETPHAAGGKGHSRVPSEASHLDELFGLVARHPLLTRVQLACLLGTSLARIAAVEATLIDRGWLRQIEASGSASNGIGFEKRDTSPALGLVELTRSGVREASARLLLAAPHAVRHHGLLASHARGRRRMLRHLAHTVGANAVFVAFAHAARAVTRLGGDDALQEWRSAAACARGRCRPDGYGCYRRGQARYGFLLEYDRGTERPREYAAKLEAYYRYQESGAAARDYVGFPTVLVVTTVTRAEGQIAHAAFLAAERHSQALPLLLTTTRQIELHAEGILGPVWRAPGPLGGIVQGRDYWLPGMHPGGLIRHARGLHNPLSQLGADALVRIQRTVTGSNTRSACGESPAGATGAGGQHRHRGLARDV